MRIMGIEHVNGTSFSRRPPNRRRRRQDKHCRGKRSFERELFAACVRNGMRPEEIRAWMRET